MTGHDRPTRVAHEFQRELSALLARGLKDPRIKGFITVTGAKMSPDLKEATAYVSIHGEEKVRKETLEGLRAAAGFLQREVAKNLRLRWVPHLRFVYDPSVEEGDKIERLLKQVKESETRRAQVQPDEAGPERAGGSGGPEASAGPPDSKPGEKEGWK